MTERTALDLSRILEQYAPMRAPEPVQPVLPSDDPQDPLCFGVPTKLGRGPLAWSTSTVLAVPERVCWDVNGYYQELGVHCESGRRAAEGQLISPEQILDEWGYAVLGEDEVDSVSPIGKDQINHEAEPWEYSFYAWKTSSYLPDESRLRRWQELLSTAATRYGVRPEMIIGATALSDQPFMLENVNGSPVVFFSEDTPLESSIADDVIESYLRISPHLQPLSAESDIS
jgi:hypothetical protein